jgi:tRNA (adenine37-N6)-methyltransferase
MVRGRRSASPLAFTPIGHVENSFDEPAAPEAIRAAESRIVLRPELAQGLLGLAAGQKLLVIFHFDRSVGYDLLQHPRGDQASPKKGVFALRSPRRPNAIGVAEVDILSIEGNILRVGGLDALNNTPVLDLKPVMSESPPPEG